MKKIAAEKNYRMFKRAEMSDEEHANYANVKQRLLKASQGAPGSDAAFYVFEAIRDTALIHSVCRNDSEEGQKNKYKSICMPHINGHGTLNALGLTEDVMTGMKSPVWDKYRETLFRSIKKHAPNANELIGWIVVNSLSIPD